MVVASAVLVAAWLVVAAGALAAERRALVRAALLVAVAQGVATVWPACTPLAVAAWFACGLGLPDGELGSWTRRGFAAAAFAAAVVWSVLMAIAGTTPNVGVVAGVVAAASAVALAAVLLRCPRAPAGRRRTLQWVAAAAVVTVATDAVLVATHLLLGAPDDVITSVLASMVVLPLGVFLGQVSFTARFSERGLVEAIVVAGLAMLVVAVYLVVVIGLARSPEEPEREVLLASVIASLTAVGLGLPLRFRLVSFGEGLLGRRGQTPEEALASFGARMSRAVPFDELLLQLVESLRATLGPAGAEVWVGTEGVLHRTVSVPEREDAVLTLDEKERLVVGRTRIGGPAWMSVWLPSLIDDRDAPIRVAPAAHLGDLLGLLVVRRPSDGVEYSDEDDRVLIELARQVGLALHNMRLDSALQASLEELRQRNEELQASRLRIVTAADASRRAIERDLHDGAQQHLVALSVKLGLAGELIKEDSALVAEMLEELRADVQSTNAAFRELAHGIYPPLLRDHGLGEALRSITRRVALPYEVDVDLPRRFSEQVEAAVYFCCLEAIQNAGKYAGPDASIEVRIHLDGDLLRFSVSDDGAGFDSGNGHGHGFVNMADRLGAIGGRLRVASTPGAGTTISGEISI
ncbi:hypothetical protein GCM10023194_00090 [Planotetraspora phitsanulokensis]|uniref:histidine kinase n=1 Tax=Planotetraspora phitsanulokensis TaxID=575192 RepID=A0A8J3XGD1_9ACTN|nr:histidine kinase [Planotetraspora phitsanulokensis]GII40040.1 hypothetical protein Pph01_50430 [Planotetraspora phitsanulokensis]